VYWTETHGGQLLSGPKLAKSCCVYQEEEVGFSTAVRFNSRKQSRHYKM